MFYDILDKKRTDILPLFKNFKEEYYLAGGTALALQIGHRDSIDFDFFKKGDIDTVVLFEKIQNIFSEHKILKIQEEKNTLTVLIDENIKISFFSYKYELLEDLKKDEYFSFASIMDIACMKLSAILSRATNKDYIDLFYIFKKYKLNEVLENFTKKYKNIDINLVLKSLVFFDDIEYEPILFKNNSEVGFDKLKDFFVDLVKKT